MYFSTIALMTAQTSVPLNTEFIVGGFSSPGDGGGGTFIWIASGFPIASPDGGITINAPLDPKGYFQRHYSGPINVRWFGAKGDGTTDDTAAVHAARNSVAFANNGTLYFPIGVYPGAFIFDYQDNDHNEINIIGDGHGSVLCSNGTKDSSLNNNPVAKVGFRFPNQQWAKIAALTIDGQFQTTKKFSDGIRIENPSTNSHGDDIMAGYWVFERVLFVNCNVGLLKPFGNIGNHFIDCTWRDNNIGVDARQDADMHAGCDRYSGGHFALNTDTCIKYTGDAAQIIIDGVIIESNNKAGCWGIQILRSGPARMSFDAVCLRNIYFEGNGNDQGGGEMNFEGVRSVRIDDCSIGMHRIRLVESSVNLYKWSCRNFPQTLHYFPSKNPTLY